MEVILVLFFSIMGCLILLSVVYLRYSLSLGDILISDLHSWIAQCLQHVSRVQAQQVSNLISV